jgi:hypothetical protein
MLQWRCREVDFSHYWVVTSVCQSVSSNCISFNRFTWKCCSLSSQLSVYLEWCTFSFSIIVMVSPVKITSSSLNTVQPLCNHQLNKKLDIKLWQKSVCAWAPWGLRITFWLYCGKACLSVSCSVYGHTCRLLNKFKYTKIQESRYLFDSDCIFYIAGTIQSIPNTSPPFLKSAFAVIMFPSLDRAQIIDPLSRIRSVLCPSFSNPFTICYKKSISHCLPQWKLRKLGA